MHEARPPKLRRVMFVFGSVLLVVALIASILLVAFTSVMNREAQWLGSSDARMRASLRTKVALLWYARASDLAVTSPSTATMDERQAAEKALLESLQATKQLATPERLAQLDSLVQRTDSYIALRDELAAQRMALPEIVRRATPSLEAAFFDLNQIVQSDDAWARSVESSVRRWDAIANVVGALTAALLLFGFGFAFFGARRLVERPILALTTAMARYAAGDERVRGVPDGPRELRQLATTFNDLAARLDRQRAERLEFVAGVAHDLRNPLAALRLATNGRRATELAKRSEDAASTLSLVSRQIDRLDRLAGDLLDAARIESGHLELREERVDLVALVHHTVELFESTSEAHTIVARTPDEPIVTECDPARIEQVLNNLVSNALKYSPKGGLVVVAVSAEDERATITVSDEGVGIAPVDREKIFEPFHRSRRSSHLVPGVGLGLSVARRIIEAHGGRLEVTSVLGEGSTFRVTLATSPSAHRGSRSDFPAPVLH